MEQVFGGEEIGLAFELRLDERIERHPAIFEQAEDALPFEQGVAALVEFQEGKLGVRRFGVDKGDSRPWVENTPCFRQRSEQRLAGIFRLRSEEHTSELQSLMRTSYAVFCLKNTNH